MFCLKFNIPLIWFCESNQIIITGFVARISCHWPVGGSHMVPQTNEQLSPLTSSISGEGITGSSGPSGSLSSLSLSGSGFNTKPVPQETKARLLGHGLQHHGKYQLNKSAELLSYPTGTATAPHPLCHPDCWSSRCNLSPLLQPLPG